MSIVVNKTRLPVTQWQTESGSVVSISDARKRYAKSLSVALEPIQDLHGYDKPWVGGAGKNKINDTLRYIASAHIVYIGAEDTGYHVPLTAGTYTFSADIGESYGAYYREANDSANTTFWPTSSALRSKSFTITADGLYRFWFYRSLANGGVDPTQIIHVQVESGSTATAYEPYSNICPISGNSAVHLHHAGTSQSDNPTSITVQLGQTVYGGSVDLVSGVGTLTMANIASYNGETIGEPWLSSMDKYVAGATPTTGAQVVYTLATPITFQLTPNQLEMLERNNTLWADEGDISVTYARIRT